MYNPIIEQQIGELKEWRKEAEQKIKDLEKQLNNQKKKEVIDLRETLAKINALVLWKQGIDDFIEKIKKILPII